MTLCAEVRLVIPDNEARTALGTLQRLGVRVAGLERTDVYRCEVEERDAGGVADAFRACELIFNPNKHVLRMRKDGAPAPGEVWISEIPGGSPTSGATKRGGPRLPGVRSLEHFTAWRLLDPAGNPARTEVVVAATQTLLCNPAFQEACFEEPRRR